MLLNVSISKLFLQWFDLLKHLIYKAQGYKETNLNNLFISFSGVSSWRVAGDKTWLKVLILYYDNNFSRHALTVILIPNLPDPLIWVSWFMFNVSAWLRRGL